MESANPFAPLYGTIYGPLYFGTLLSTGLYGVTCMQTFFYYVHYRNDSLRMKCFVAAVWVFDTISEALVISGVYKYIMATLVNPAAVLVEIPELPLLVSISTQGFFVYRIYLFSGKNIVTPILWVIQVIYQIVSTIRYIAKALYTVDGSLHVVGFTVLNDSFFKDIIISCLSLAAAIDVLIAIAMTFLLLRKRSESGFARSAHILQRLTMFSVNTGIWTATFAVLEAILMHVFSTSLLFVLFGFPLASLYCNALLANLNARSYIRGEGMGHDASADLVTMNSPVSGESMAENRSGETRPEFISSICLDIRKTTEVVTFVDDGQFTTPENTV